MYEFIPSTYYRKYCKKNGIDITDRDLAAAILNGDLDPLDKEEVLLEDKFSALKKIAAETADDELKVLISEVIENSETALKNLKNGGENCIYRVGTTILLPTEEELYSHDFFTFTITTQHLIMRSIIPGIKEFYARLISKDSEYSTEKNLQKPAIGKNTRISIHRENYCGYTAARSGLLINYALIMPM